MFDKVSQAAEQVAINVSRRAFMGRLGQGALATAGVLGTMLVFGGKAGATGPCAYCSKGSWCCQGFPVGYYCSPKNIGGGRCYKIS